MPDRTQSTDTQRGGSGVTADERSLIDHARRGNHIAFRCLVELHMRGVYDIAFRFTQDHAAADDLAQETFIRAYDSLDSFRGDAGFGTWLYRIVSNLSLNRLKEMRRRRGHEISAASHQAITNPDASDAVQANDATAHLEKALHELPTMQRAVVMLRHVDGLSTRQVSRILSCSEGTVKTHLFRGLEKLRQRLEFLDE